MKSIIVQSEEGESQIKKGQDLEAIIASIRETMRMPQTQIEMRITLLEKMANAYMDLGNLCLENSSLKAETLPDCKKPEDFFEKAVQLRTEIIIYELKKASRLAEKMHHSKEKTIFTQCLVSLEKIINR